MEQDNRAELSRDIIAGKNPVIEALRSGRPIDSVLIARESAGGAVSRIAALCREKSVPLKEVSPAKLEGLCAGLSHQGVVAIAAAHAYADLSDILEAAEARGEPPFLIIADEIAAPRAPTASSSPSGTPPG